MPIREVRADAWRPAISIFTISRGVGEMYEKEIGNRLRYVRESKGLSRKEVEILTAGEFKESILAMYENARRRLPTPRLKRLADFYSVSASFFLGESVREPNKNHEDIEALLLSDPLYTEDERKLLLDVIEIIRAKRRAEGREARRG